MLKVEKTKKNLMKCICVKCKSYTFACKVKNAPGVLMNMLKSDLSKVETSEKLFCAFGKSKCIKEEKGCICGQCPIFKENNLNTGYFCTTLGGK